MPTAPTAFLAVINIDDPDLSGLYPSFASATRVALPTQSSTSGFALSLRLVTPSGSATGPWQDIPALNMVGATIQATIGQPGAPAATGVTGFTLGSDGVTQGATIPLAVAGIQTAFAYLGAANITLVLQIDVQFAGATTFQTVYSGPITINQSVLAAGVPSTDLGATIPFVNSAVAAEVVARNAALAAETARAEGAEAGLVSRILPYGTPYNKTTWADLSDFDVAGTAPTIIGGKIQFTGGSTLFNQYVGLAAPTCLHNWKITVRVLATALTASSEGIAVGVASANTSQPATVAMQLLLRSDQYSGYVRIYAFNASTYQLVSAVLSTSGFTISPGDYVKGTFERQGDLLTASLWNDTTHTPPITVSYRMSLAFGATLTMHNTGRFAVFNIDPSGSVSTLDSLEVQSEEYKSADVAFVGDSKTAGYFAGNYALSFASQVGRSYRVANLGGGSDATGNALSRVGEVIALAPRAAVLCIGRNDIGQNVPTATMEANYTSIVSQLQAAGIIVYHLLPLFETTVNQAVLTNFITADLSRSEFD